MNAYKIAKSWYKEDQIAQEILRLKSIGNGIPEDIYSDEFALWLTEQYRLAMMKGFELALNGELAL